MYNCQSWVWNTAVSLSQLRLAQSQSPEATTGHIRLVCNMSVCWIILCCHRWVFLNKSWILNQLGFFNLDLNLLDLWEYYRPIFLGLFTSRPTARLSLILVDYTPTFTLLVLYTTDAVSDKLIYRFIWYHVILYNINIHIVHSTIEWS